MPITGEGFRTKQVVLTDRIVSMLDRAKAEGHGNHSVVIRRALSEWFVKHGYETEDHAGAIDNDVRHAMQIYHILAAAFSGRSGDTPITEVSVPVVIFKSKYGSVKNAKQYIRLWENLHNRLISNANVMVVWDDDENGSVSFGFESLHLTAKKLYEYKARIEERAQQSDLLSLIYDLTEPEGLNTVSTVDEVSVNDETPESP